jgi:DNA-binding MarR family transcriptional regulator
VGRKLRGEIRQKKPFASPEEELFLEIQRTADVLMQSLERLLKPTGLTQTQYNVLRILRGAGAGGLLCREVGQRMVTHDPDVTRLLDRLERRRLVARGRERRDRRVVRVRITESGMNLLGSLDLPVTDLHHRQLGPMGRQRIRRIMDFVEEMRRGPV